MASDRQDKSSSGFGIFSIFKSKRGGRKVEQDPWDDGLKAYKVWPSDEDGRLWVAIPSVDREASAYIAKVLAGTQYAKCQAFAVCNQVN